MPKVTPSTMADLFTAYEASFNAGMGLADTATWQRLAMIMPSSAKQNVYTWLADIPGLRRWLGDRVVHRLQAEGYTVPNIEYEDTVEVKIRDIETDQHGLFAPLIRVMGEAYAAFPGKLVFDHLAAGFTTLCYDGQYFFDSDHPVLDAAGAPQSVSNTGGGNGTAWYLMALGRALKPLMFQERAAEPFKSLTPQELIDRNKSVEYGCYRDCAAAYGFWQLAYGSKQTLNASNYAAARAAMGAFTGDYGRKLGIIPDTLVVPMALEGAGRQILTAENDASGASNVWRGTAQLLVARWLE